MKKFFRLTAVIIILVIFAELLSIFVEPVGDAFRSVKNFFEALDFSHSEIEVATYYSPNVKLTEMTSSINLSGEYTEADFDFSAYPESFRAGKYVCSVHTYSDSFDFSPKETQGKISKQLQKDFEIAKELANRFVEEYGLSVSLDSIELKVSFLPLNYLQKNEGVYFIYHQNVIYYSGLNMVISSDEEIVQMILAEFLKVIQEQTLGRREYSYFNEYMSSTIADAICGESNSKAEYKPCLYFVRAVGAEEAISAYLFGFDSLISTGKIAEPELKVYKSLVQVINSSLGGQSNNHEEYLNSNNLSDGRIDDILKSIACIWETRQ